MSSSQQDFWERLQRKYHEKTQALQKRETELRYRLEALQVIASDGRRDIPVPPKLADKSPPPSKPSSMSRVQSSIQSEVRFSEEFLTKPYHLSAVATPSQVSSPKLAPSQESDSKSCPCKGGFFKNILSMIPSLRSSKDTTVSTASSSPPKTPPPGRRIGGGGNENYKNENCQCISCPMDQPPEPAPPSDGSVCSCKICDNSNHDSNCTCSTCIQITEGCFCSVHKDLALRNQSEDLCNVNNKDYTLKGPPLTATEQPKVRSDGDSVCKCSICSKTSNGLCCCNYELLMDGEVLMPTTAPRSLLPISPSKLSLKSADLFYMKNIQDMAIQQKALLQNIAEMERKAKVYEDVFNEYKDVDVKEGRTMTMAPAADRSEDDKLTAELKIENCLLKNELKEMRLEVRQYIERMEGPMVFKIESEKYKNSQLEAKLEQAAQEMAEVQKMYDQELNALKMQLCTANNNVYNLTGSNHKLAEELQSAKAKYSEMNEELIRLKISEGEALKTMQAMKNAQSVMTAATPPGKEQECNLHSIARELSHILKECEPCGECLTLPDDLTTAAKLLKNLTDMIDEKMPKNGDEAGEDEVVKDMTQAGQVEEVSSGKVVSIQESYCSCPSDAEECPADRKSDTSGSRGDTSKKSSAGYLEGKPSETVKSVKSEKSAMSSASEKSEKSVTLEVKPSGGTTKSEKSVSIDVSSKTSAASGGSMEDRQSGTAVKSEKSALGMVASEKSEKSVTLDEGKPSSTADEEKVSIRTKSSDTKSVKSVTVAKSDQGQLPPTGDIVSVNTIISDAEDNNKSTVKPIITAEKPSSIARDRGSADTLQIDPGFRKKSCVCPPFASAIVEENAPLSCKCFQPEKGAASPPPTSMSVPDSFVQTHQSQSKSCICARCSKVSPGGGPGDITASPTPAKSSRDYSHLCPCVKHQPVQPSALSEPAVRDEVVVVTQSEKKKLCRCVEGKKLIPEKENMTASGYNEFVPAAYVGPPSSAMKKPCKCDEKMKAGVVTAVAPPTATTDLVPVRAGGAATTEVDRIWPKDSEKLILTHQVTGSRDMVKSQTSMKGFNVTDNFPFNVDTHVDVIDKRPDGVHVTTTITNSGILEVVTEGPEGFIETTLIYTKSGNVEVVTEILEYNAKGQSKCNRGKLKATSVARAGSCTKAIRAPPPTEAVEGSRAMQQQQQQQGPMRTSISAQSAPSTKQTKSSRSGGMNPNCQCKKCVGGGEGVPEAASEMGKASIKSVMSTASSRTMEGTSRIGLPEDCKCLTCPQTELKAESDKNMTTKTSSIKSKASSIKSKESSIRAKESAVSANESSVSENVSSVKLPDDCRCAVCPQTEVITASGSKPDVKPSTTTTSSAGCKCKSCKKN